MKTLSTRLKYRWLFPCHNPVGRKLVKNGLLLKILEFTFSLRIECVCDLTSCDVLKLSELFVSSVNRKTWSGQEGVQCC